MVINGVCVLRWKEAFEAGCTPKVDLEATNEAALKYVSIDNLIKCAIKEMKFSFCISVKLNTVTF